MTLTFIPIEDVIAFAKDQSLPPHQWVQWGCDCAERALHHYEARYPTDTRPRDALAATRLWLAQPIAKQASPAKLHAAAHAAAYAAHAAHAAANAAAHAANAAANAAYAAAYAAHAAHAAAHAAYAAAYAAHAAYAANAATYAAAHAGDKEQEILWQATRLLTLVHEGGYVT